MMETPSDNAENERPQYSGPILFYNNEDVIDHFANPRNVGELFEGETDGFGLVGDPSCGGQMKLWISIRSDRIEKIAFKSFGCPGAIAASSMLTELAKGRTIEAARRITDDDVVEAIGGIPERKNTVLSWACLPFRLLSKTGKQDSQKVRNRDYDLPRRQCDCSL
jgi:nitrogen fixation NifU-like protein